MDKDSDPIELMQAILDALVASGAGVVAATVLVTYGDGRQIELNGRGGLVRSRRKDDQPSLALH